MDPFRPVTIDTRMPAAQFVDGGPITDGIANLLASAINAPVAAGQIRRQRQMDERQVRLQDQALERQAQQDQLAQLWRGQDVERQGRLDALAAEFQKAQIGNIQADNARQMMAMFGNGMNNAAARGIDAVKAIGSLFSRGKGTASQAAQADWYIFDSPDGSKLMLNKRTGEIKPAVQTTPDGQPVAEAPAGETGWPLVPTLAAGAAGGAGALAVGKKLMTKGAAKAAAPAAATAARAGALGRALPVAGRVLGALASAPVAIGTAGVTGAIAGNSAVRNDLNPVDGNHMDVLRAYASGDKGIKPSWVTRFGQAMTSWPAAYGGSGSQGKEAEVQQRHVGELVQALAIAIPEGDPNKGRILAEVENAAWNDPSRAQALVAKIYTNLSAQGQ